MRLFLDTNVFLRYFAKDDEEMYRLSASLFSLVDEGRIQSATSTIVLTEIIYTLKSFYRQDKENIQKHIDSVLGIKNILLIEKTQFKKAFGLFKQASRKISDCLIVTQIPPSYVLCSFDERLEKVIGKKRFIHPKDVNSGGGGFGGDVVN